MSRWFRHYAGMCRDEKLVRAAIKAGQPIERVVWIWCAILESAAEIDDGGRYEIDHAEMAWFLRADERDLVSVEDALRALGRVHEGAVAKWGDRQFVSDRSSERQKRYRERHRDAKRDENEASRNVTVASPSRHGDAPETETETDIPSEAKASSGHVGETESERAERELFERGKIVLGKTAGGLIARLLKTKGGSIAQARAAIELASTKADPKEFIGRIVSGAGPPVPQQPFQRWAL